MPVVLLLGIAPLGACGSDNTLSGSAGESLSLAFDSTVFFAQGAVVTLEYKKGSDVVCEIAVNTGGSSLGSSGELTGADFLSRVTLSRATAKQDNFTGLLSGSLTFSSLSLTSQQKVAGSFNFLLVDGTTLLGKFSGNLQ